MIDLAGSVCEDILNEQKVSDDRFCGDRKATIPMRASGFADESLDEEQAQKKRREVGRKNAFGAVGRTMLAALWARSLRP